MTKIFLSYGREDEKSAARLHKALQRAGYEIWFDRASLLPGERWKSSIVKAIRSAGAVVILLSKSSCNRSGFLNREIREALELLAEQPESKPFLIPVRLDNCEPSHSELTALHRVDIFPEWKRGLRELRKALYVVNPSKKASTKRIRAFIQITIRSVDDVGALIEKMLKIKNVVSVGLTIGSIDFMVVVEARTSEALKRTVEAVIGLEEIEQTATSWAVPSRLRSGIKAMRSRC